MFTTTRIMQSEGPQITMSYTLVHNGDNQCLQSDGRTMC